MYTHTHLQTHIHLVSGRVDVVAQELYFPGSGPPFNIIIIMIIIILYIYIYIHLHTYTPMCLFMLHMLIS